jgi:hypothetical protein
MTFRPFHLPLAVLLVGLAGCAADTELAATSTCHTSDGQFVAAPGCSIRYSSSRTVTTTTTTVTTTETDAPKPDKP